MTTGPNASGLCMCGCGRPTPIAKKTSARDRTIKGQPTRYLLGHHMRTSPVDYIVNAETGCWEWQLRVDHNGYGLVERSGCWLAHRLYYQYAYGPIPAGYQVDHLCGNRRCVNPEHLEAVLPAENSRRAGGTVLSAEQIAAIRGSAATQQSLATQYRISQSTVSDVKRGRTWKDVQL